MSETPKPVNKPVAADPKKTPQAQEKPVKEIGGQEGPDPTRYGDWEKGGRCTDF